jgi:hypothetical protein
MSNTRPLNGLIGLTTTQLDTPFKNPSLEEVSCIEVTDQTHPLFGRRFQVISVSTPLNTSGHVFVRYREKAVLQIPITATNLAPSPITTRTKLTSQALEEFISLADQYEVLCQSNHRTSGDDSPLTSGNKSSRTSRRSSRR